MRYLLSDLTITDVELDYLTDLMKVYFSIESVEVPNLRLGIRRYLPTNDRSVLTDMITEDISNFIDVVNQQGIGLTLVNIAYTNDRYEVKFRYGSNNINLTIE